MLRLRLALLALVTLLVLPASTSPGESIIGGHRRMPSLAHSDDFNACTLNQSLWEIQNASIDFGVGNVGAGSGDSHLTLSITGAQTHDPWVPDTAPAILQPLPAGDWVREARFTSQLPAIITGHGMKVADGSGDFIRADVYRSSGGTNFFVGFVTPTTPTTIYNALISSGQIAPLRIRISYTAGTYDIVYSADDGVNYQRPAGFTPFTESGFTPTKAGVLVANEISGGSIPDYTAEVDWFNVAAGPPTGEDVGTLPGHTFSLSTAGTGTGTVSKSPDQASYACAESVCATATRDTGSAFTGWSGDLSGTLNPECISLDLDRSATANFTVASSSPIMALSTTSLTQTVTQGVDASPLSFAISNSGGGTLHWATSSNASWVSASPASGTTTTTPSTVTLSFATASLAVGNYSATITVTSSDVPQQQVVVSLTVDAPGAKLWPDGSSDTGLNAVLFDLPGHPEGITCQAYCNSIGAGSLPLYPPSGVTHNLTTAGQTIECKSFNSKILVNAGNITFRCNDISAPGDTQGVLIAGYNAPAPNLRIEGNKLHDGYQQSKPNCGTHIIVLYNSDALIQWNDMYHGDQGLITDSPAGHPLTTFQWNYWHDSYNSDTCPGAHTEAVHCQGPGLCPTTIHNRLIHATAAQGYSGTATYTSGKDPAGIRPDGEDVEYNLMQGGAYTVQALGGPNATWRNNVVVGGAWIYGAHSFALQPAIFSGNTCTNGHVWDYFHGAADACSW